MMLPSRPGVALALTIHEPEGRLLPLLTEQLPALAARYAALAAFCSPTTHPGILELLRTQVSLVVVDTLPASGMLSVGRARRETLRAGLQTGAGHLHLCDFDRALHWAAHFPAELEQVVGALPGYDLLVLGRTERAWASHPPYQTETECVINLVFELATGLAWDIGAGSRGLSRRAAEWLLRTSRDETVGSDAEWLLLLLRAGDPAFRCDYLACEGLEFETPDRFADEIEAAGGYTAWEARMSADPQHWAFRLQVAELILKAIGRAYEPAPRP